jgi:hypothetical protein
MFKKFLDHNAAILMSVVWCCIALLWFYGCEVKTTSLVLPNVKVTRAELEIEIDTLASQAKLKFADLERQELLRKSIADHLSVVAQGGGINTTGVMNLIVSMLGLGSILTYRKKDSVIKTLKNNARSSNTTPG